LMVKVPRKNQPWPRPGLMLLDMGRVNWA
jgi:hypothetical protein